MNDHEKIELLLRIKLVLSGSRHFTISKQAERFDCSIRSIQRFMATFRIAGFIIASRNARNLYPAVEKPILLIVCPKCFTGERLHITPGFVFKSISVTQPSKKEKTSCPALNVLLTDRLRMRGVRETFKKKAPVLKDEGGLNVFTTE